MDNPAKRPDDARSRVVGQIARMLGVPIEVLFEAPHATEPTNEAPASGIAHEATVLLEGFLQLDDQRLRDLSVSFVQGLVTRQEKPGDTGAVSGTDAAVQDAMAWVVALIQERAQGAPKKM